MRVEQGVDLVLQNLKLKKLGQPHDDVLLTTDRRFKHYKANDDRIIPKHGLLFRKYYAETGSVKYYQTLIAQQLVSEVLRRLHGEFGKHPGITKTIIAYREKNYYPNKAQLVTQWVMSCEQCIQESGIERCVPTLPCKIRMSKSLRRKTPCKLIWCWDYLRPVAMKILWQPWVFFLATYLPTLHLTRDAKTIAKMIINIMTKHAYPPATLISDKGSAFKSHLIEEMASLLGITLKHAIKKHAKTIGMPEQSHASVKQALEIETGKRISLWQKYVNIAVLNNNTSFHASLDWLWAKQNVSWTQSI